MGRTYKKYSDRNINDFLCLFKGDIGMLYIDAHADLNTADTSPSGNVHGMALALLVKELHDYWPYLPGMDWQKPLLVCTDHL